MLQQNDENLGHKKNIHIEQIGVGRENLNQSAVMLKYLKLN